MSGALSDERSGLSFTVYNVQYICILHAILRYADNSSVATEMLSPNCVVG
jgi:hypothetical protein